MCCDCFCVGPGLNMERVSRVRIQGLDGCHAQAPEGSGCEGVLGGAPGELCTGQDRAGVLPSFSIFSLPRRKLKGRWCGHWRNFPAELTCIDPDFRSGDLVLTPRPTSRGLIGFSVARPMPLGKCGYVPQRTASTGRRPARDMQGLCQLLKFLGKGKHRGRMPTRVGPISCFYLNMLVSGDPATQDD